MTPGESVDIPVARAFTLPREGEVIQHQGCNYHLGKYIGEGSWGAVFHCRGIEIRLFSGNRQGTAPACGESHADGPRFLEEYLLCASDVRISSRNGT